MLFAVSVTCFALHAALAAEAPDERWRLLAREAEASAADPPMPTNGTFFAGALTDHAVLQRGSATKAAVYGVSFGATSDTKVTVTVAEQGQPSYSVAAEMIPIPGVVAGPGEGSTARSQ